MKSKVINYSSLFLALSLLMLMFNGCQKKDDDNDDLIPPGDTTTVDALTEADIQAIDAMLLDSITKFIDLRFPDNTSVYDFLMLHDPSFLAQHPSGKTSDNADLENKNALLISRMLGVGYHLADRSQHIDNEAVPNLNGIFYSFGSKQYQVRKPPRAGTCNMDKSYHGLDCSGFIFQLADQAYMQLDTFQNECGTGYLKNEDNYNNALAGNDYDGIKAVNIGPRKLEDLAIGDIIVWNYGHCGICDGKVGNDIGMLNCSGYPSSNCEQNFSIARGVVRRKLTNGYLNYEGGSQVIRFSGHCFELAADTNVSDNSVEIWASGGTPPFEFSLDGGAFEEVGAFVYNAPYNPHKTYTDLLPGEHYVKVKDMLDCEDSLAFTISLCDGTLDLAVSRSGKTLTASATGGTPPYQYNFNGTFSSNTVSDMVSDGRYSVVVEDANGCTDTVTDCFSDVVINSITCTPLNLVDEHPRGQFSISYSSATGLIPSVFIFFNNQYIMSGWLITGGNSSTYTPNLTYCDNSGMQIPYTASLGFTGTEYNRTVNFLLSNTDQILGASNISFRISNYCNGISVCPSGPYHQTDLWSSEYNISW